MVIVLLFGIKKMAERLSKHIKNDWRCKPTGFGHLSYLRRYTVEDKGMKISFDVTDDATGEEIDREMKRVMRELYAHTYQIRVDNANPFIRSKQ